MILQNVFFYLKTTILISLRLFSHFVNAQMSACCCTETQQAAGFIQTPRREKLFKQHAGETAESETQLEKYMTFQRKYNTCFH